MHTLCTHCEEAIASCGGSETQSLTWEKLDFQKKGNEKEMRFDSAVLLLHTSSESTDTQSSAIQAAEGR